MEKSRQEHLGQIVPFLTEHVIGQSEAALRVANAVKRPWAD
jgi:ATP-dependent Clp protease ATP-binding subunit ClpA